MKHNYFGNTRAAKAIYGIILSFVLLYGLDHIGINDGTSIAVKLLLGALSITIAEIYSETVGERIAKQKKLDRKERKQIVQDAFAIVSVTLIPVFFFMLAGLGLFSVETAFRLGYAYYLLALFIFNYYAGVLSRASRRNAFLFALISTYIGVLAITLKYAFGH
jgi:hypothetical protein